MLARMRCREARERAHVVLLFSCATGDEKFPNFSLRVLVICHRFLLIVLEVLGKVYSTAEAVQGAALALERVHDVHGGHGLAAGVLGVGHRVADDKFFCFCF